MYRIIITIVMILLFLILIIFYACEEKSTKPPLMPQITLSLSEEPRLTEIRLKVELKNVSLPEEIELTRNGYSVYTILMAEEDSVIRDKELKPATDYNYQAYLLNNNVKTDSSNLLETSTMDTTTHDFIWEIYTVPPGDLWDVFAISEDDVWAVGEVYTDSGEYNAVHWDGNDWEVVNIETEYMGNLISVPTFGIWGFSENDLWASSGLPKNWDGIKWTLYHLWDMGILNQDDGDVPHIWGTSSSNMYFAGPKGTMVQYNGTDWTKLDSGTDLNISDIWGLPGDYLIANAGSSNPLEIYLLIYKNGILERSISNTQYLTGDLWGTTLDNIYMVGDGILHFDGDSLNRLDWPPNVPVNFMRAVRGTAANNIFVAGGFGIVLHFNGSSWHYYPQLNNSGILTSVSIIGNEVFIAGSGFTYGAVILHGSKI